MAVVLGEMLRRLSVSPVTSDVENEKCDVSSTLVHCHWPLGQLFQSAEQPTLKQREHPGLGWPLLASQHTTLHPARSEYWGTRTPRTSFPRHLLKA